MNTIISLLSESSKEAVTSSLDDDEVRALRTFIEHTQLVHGEDMTTTGVSACEKFLWLVKNWEKRVKKNEEREEELYEKTMYEDSRNEDYMEGRS